MDTSRLDGVSTRRDAEIAPSLLTDEYIMPPSAIAPSGSSKPHRSAYTLTFAPAFVVTVNPILEKSVKSFPDEGPFSVLKSL